MEPEQLDLRSYDTAEDKRQELLRLFPEIRTEGGKIDFERLKLALGESVDVGKERYGMNWPGKADCFRAIQSPSLGTLRPCPEESVNFDQTENLIIEGDNLEVLKLLQKSLPGKVKMIYIDPPYNTGNDFIYPDNYSESLQTYLEYTGQVDAEGKKFSTNAETDGRFHSKWLNMMYPRLYLARNLLRDDGLIFVSIDDNEIVNLRSLMDEIFGPDNFLGQITILSNPRGRQSEIIATTHEYLIAYARNEDIGSLQGQSLSDTRLDEYKYETSDGRKYRLRGLRHRGNASRRTDRPKMFFPIFVNPTTREVSLQKSAAFSVEVFPRKSSGEDGRWEWGPETTKERIHLLEAVLIAGREEWDIYQREFLIDEGGQSRSLKWKSVWDEKDINYQNGKGELKDLFGDSPLDYPKPTYLLRKVIEGAADENDLVLDFFAGSGSTAHALLDLNEQDGGHRSFILVQLPESTGRADYPTIADICKERVRRVIKKLSEEDEEASPSRRSRESGNPDLFVTDELDSRVRGNDGVRNQPQDRGFKVLKLAQSNFNPWNAEVPQEAGALEKQLDLHVDHIRDNRTADDLLYELLLKSGYPLTAPVEVLQLAGKQVHSVAGGVFFVCLERELTLELIRAMADKKPERVVCLDEGFAGNDQLKANAVQIFKTKEVTSFKTV
ncbi:MAG: site-specific DNA-methyltransferase [Nitrospira sp.]|nr:site-specific DNA-methyltransferase [Nitrospira sp.]